MVIIENGLLAELRVLIDRAPLSRYAIARRAGIADCILTRFARGGGLSIGTLERLCAALDARVVIVSHKARHRRDRRAMSELATA